MPYFDITFSQKSLELILSPLPPRTTLTWTCPTMIFVHFTLALVHEICYTLLQEDGQHCSGGEGADWQTRMAVSYGAVSFLEKFIKI